MYNAEMEDEADNLEEWTDSSDSKIEGLFLDTLCTHSKNG
jgi:hypothetical protein